MAQLGKYAIFSRIVCKLLINTNVYTGFSRISKAWDVAFVVLIGVKSQIYIPFGYWEVWLFFHVFVKFFP